MHTTMKELRDTVFSIQFVVRLYNEAISQVDRVISQKLTVVSQRSEVTVPVDLKLHC
jgi:hypothetical protein